METVPLAHFTKVAEMGASILYTSKKPESRTPSALKSWASNDLNQSKVATSNIVSGQ